MTLKISTGLRDGILNATGIKESLDGGCLRIYTGTEPATADAAIAVGNTLLCTVTNDATGTGVTFAAPVAGVLSKTSSETWRGVNAATGTASFFRYSTLADAGASSTTIPRIQGTVGVSGSDLLVDSVSFTSAASTTIKSVNISMPTA